MPLSDLPWAPSYSHYNGTKRKFCQDDGTQQEEETEESMSKRRCMASHTAVTEADQSIQTGQHLNINSVTMATDVSHQQQTMPEWPAGLYGQGAVSCTQDLNSNIMANAQVFVQQPESQLTCTVIPSVATPQIANPPSQDDMIMDLNDETYSTAQIDMYSNEDQAYHAMDSDCVPNPSQYNIQTLYNQCGPSGDHPPTSSPVKCYCRPSWETYNDLQYYVSDYY